MAKKEVKQEQKKIAETKPAKKEIKSEPKEKFSLAQWFKGISEGINKGVNVGVNKKVKPEKTVITKNEPVKKEIKSEQKKITEPKTVAKKEVKQETKKIVETKPAKKEIKPAEEKFSAKIKTKYNDLKAKYDEGKTNKIKTSEENVKYTTVILQDNDNTSSATRYINTRPRYNSINYSPQFDNSVNDI